MQSEHVNLIETLAERIASQCLADRRVERVRVRIEKPDVRSTAARSASRSSGAGRRPPSGPTRQPYALPHGRHGSLQLMPQSAVNIRSGGSFRWDKAATRAADCPPCRDGGCRDIPHGLAATIRVEANGPLIIKGL